jgi:hypothetical protein
MADAAMNFATSTVAIAPSPATSGTTLSVQSGQGARFPAAPFNAIVFPANQNPLLTNAEIIRVTDKGSGDDWTIQRLTNTEPNNAASARAIQVGDQIWGGITGKTLNDKASLSGDTFTGLLQFSGTGHAGLKANSLTTTQRDALTPSDGIFFYNSTAKLLQAYFNSAYRNLGQRTATIYLATAASGYAADYICPGSADDLVIQAAANALPSTGGELVFLDGTYNFVTEVVLPNPQIKVRGMGQSTIFRWQANANPTGLGLFQTNDYCELSDFQINGNKTGNTGGLGLRLINSTRVWL